MRTLIAGWFSFEEGHATGGDLAALDLARAWLDEASQPYDIAFAPMFSGGLDWRAVDPRDYSHVVFVCGPFGTAQDLELPFLERFGASRLIGLNLSMQRVDGWNPFDVLLERTYVTVRPDIAFLAPPGALPLVGVCRVEAYEGGETERANRAINTLTGGARVAAVEIDTRLDVNAGGLRSAEEIQSIIARMDAVITTRLHGLVFALKNGVPALAIDPEPQRGKIIRQARAIGWPVVFAADALAPEGLREALDYCLTTAARAAALACAERAMQSAEDIHQAFVACIARVSSRPL